MRPSKVFKSVDLRKTIRAADCNLLVALDLDVDGLCQRRCRSRAGALCLDDEARGRAVGLEVEVRFRLLLALRQDLHLVGLLLAAVGHAARRDARIAG